MPARNAARRVVADRVDAPAERGGAEHEGDQRARSRATGQVGRDAEHVAFDDVLHRLRRVGRAGLAGEALGEAEREALHDPVHPERHHDRGHGEVRDADAVHEAGREPEPEREQRPPGRARPSRPSEEVTSRIAAPFSTHGTERSMPPIEDDERLARGDEADERGDDEDRLDALRRCRSPRCRKSPTTKTRIAAANA